MPHCIEIIVQLIDNRYANWHMEAWYLIIWYALQMFDQCLQAKLSRIYF